MNKTCLTMTLKKQNWRRLLAILMLVAISIGVVACSAPAPAQQPSATQPPATQPSASQPTTAPQATTAPQPTTAPPPADAPVSGGTLIMGFSRDFPTLDPPVPNSDFLNRVLNSVLDPLVWQPEPGKFYPGLAESWEVSPDAKTYTFKLRKDVKFQDGTPFNAQAVKFTFDRVADPKTKALLVFLIGPYDKTEVIDDYTVKVSFKAPYPLFLHNLSATGARPISPTAVQKWGDDFGQHIVGTGPFMLTKYTKDEYTFTKFPDYNWAPTFLNHKGPAYLDGFTYRLIPEDATRVIALEKGEVQYIDAVPAQDYKRLSATFNMKTIDLPGLPQILQMNVTRPLMSDKRVRQAIQLAVDHKKIVDVVFFGLVRPAYGVLSSPTLGYWKGVEDLYKYDPAKAKALLQEAGWKPGSDGIMAKDGQRLSLLYVTTNTATTVQTGEVIQGMLKEVGIEMKIEAMTNAASLARYQVGDYDIGRLGEQNADPSIMSAPVHSRNIKGGTQGNRSKYSNPDVDAKLDAAEQEVDLTKRLKMYEDLQKTVMDEAFILGGSEQALFFASAKSIQNLAYDNVGRHYLLNTWIKK